MTSRTGQCECCWKRAGRFAVVDDNWETWLCGPCAKELRNEVDTVVFPR